MTLIDVGTSGAVTVLLPNAFGTSTQTRAGVVRLLPDADAPEFDLELGGPPGQERVLAIATADPLPLPPPQGDDAFRRLDEGDVTGLEQALAARPPDRWAAADCQFEVR